MKKLLIIILALTGFIGCESKNQIEKDIENIALDFELVRFDKIFGQAQISDIPNLKVKYPMFFPKQFADSIWEQRIQDTLQQQLHSAVEDVYGDNSILQDELLPLFKHIKYYFPEFVSPRVYTTTSDVDYKSKTILADSVLVIGLDTYLGEDHEFYEGIQKFTSKNMKPSQIAPDVATQYSRTFIAPPQNRSLLAQMIYFGKELYLKDLWLPQSTDATKIGYTEDEYSWAEANELLLFSTDTKLPPRFINPAPFSKFYLELDTESPGMIGRYLGWKIVRSYMESNNITPAQLMIMEPEIIFKESKYKPAK